VETKTPEIIDVELAQDGHGWSVRPVWSGVDRPNTGGWGFGSKRLAERMRSALLAGVVYSKIEVVTDASGKTFVHGTSLVLGRYANADLKKLGF
jgi:hypothetical protein